MGICLNTEDSKNQKEYYKSLSEIDSIINDPSLMKISSENLTYSDIHYFVMLIQTNYRRYIAKKKYKEKLLNKLEYKKNLLKSSITFKESWELYFNNNSEYEFSFKGLEELRLKLIDFYKNFFNFDLINEGDIYITNNQIKKFNFESLMKSDFRTALIIYLSKTFYLGDKIENRIQNSEIFFETIKKNEEFLETGVATNFATKFEETLHLKNKNFSFVSLSEEDEQTLIDKKSNFEDNNHNDKLSNFEDNKEYNIKKNFFNLDQISESPEKQEIQNFRKENAKKKKTFIHAHLKEMEYHELFKKNINENYPIQTKLNNSDKNNNDNTNQNKIQSKFTKSKLRYLENKISKLNYVNGKIPLYILDKDKYKDESYFLRFLNEIKFFQEKYCEIRAFQDENTSIIYSGSYNTKFNQKEGLGFEYMIDSKKGNIYKYCGYYYKNKFHGIGMLAKNGNENYIGEFRFGKKSGYGYLTCDNFKYTGFFYNDKFEGYGELHIEGKYSYSGIWKNGKKHGFGFYINCDGCTYCGEFDKGNLNGVGIFKWQDKQNYFGYWENNLMNGYGEFEYKNGDYFYGYYKSDKKNGKGLYKFKNGNRLTGKWIRGKKEGEFSLYNPKNKNIIIFLRYEGDYQIKIV